MSDYTRTGNINRHCCNPLAILKEMISLMTIISLPLLLLVIFHVQVIRARPSALGVRRTSDVVGKTRDDGDNALERSKKFDSGAQPKERIQKRFAIAIPFVVAVISAAIFASIAVGLASVC